MVGRPYSVGLQCMQWESSRGEFHKYKKGGREPNRVTFLMKGLTSSGRWVNDYEISLDIKHYVALTRKYGYGGRSQGLA